MKKAVLTAVAGIASVAVASSAMAIITPFTETFSYADGDLTAVSGGLWAAHSGAATAPIQVTGGAAQLTQPGSAEDANRIFGSVGAGETVYAAFDFTVSGSSSTVYFAHFKNATTGFQSRVFVSAPVGGGDYNIAFDSTSTASNFWASDFGFGTTHRAVISYNFTTGENRLWIDPVNMASTSIGEIGIAGVPMQGFALRQSSGGSTQTIDNLNVGDSFASVIPSPGALALIGLGGLTVARRRRA